MKSSLSGKLTALLALALPAGCGKKPPEAVEPSAIAPPAPTAAAELSSVPGLSDRSGEAPLATVFAKADPTKDDAWSSEALSDAIGEKLTLLGKAIDAAEFGDLGEVLAESAVATPLRPEAETVFEGGSIHVVRLPLAQTAARPRTPVVAALEELRKSFAPDGKVRTKFKVVRVIDGNPTVALVRAEIVGTLAESGLTANLTAQWSTNWNGSKESPRLASIHLVKFEESSGASRFHDLTESVLGDNPGFRDQLRHGADYWYGNLDVSFGVHHGNQGIAVGDANGDGRDDVLVGQPAGLPLRFFLSEEDGTFRDATEEAGLDWLDNARSALFVDIDNDGDQDLALSLGYSVVLFENDGEARFAQNVIVDVHSWPSSIVSADADLDGDLDFYICGYNPRGETAPGDIFANPVPYHDANNGARNFYLENLGNFEFADRTDPVGLSQNNRRFSFAAAFEDYDNDGDPDLYVANDFGRNNLYRNDLAEDGSRRFVDVAADAGVEDIAAGMSVSWGDYNRDGLMDLYVSNMFSAAGSRVTYQRKFKESSDAETLANLRRHARGNTLFENAGDGTFRDVSNQRDVTMGRWAWASLFTDINNDGWQDLYVTNGFFTTPDTGDL